MSSPLLNFFPQSLWLKEKWLEKIAWNKRYEPTALTSVG
jgi:hypothetical protein